jgi:hypothetical protein
VSSPLLSPSSLVVVVVVVSTGAARAVGARMRRAVEARKVRSWWRDWGLGY